MLDIERVDFVRIPVTDIERAREFYEGVLGFERNPNAPAEDWLEYEVGNVTLVVMTPQTHDSESAQLPLGAIALRVPDVEEAKTALQQSGVQTSEVWDSGVCKMIDVQDPAGNGLLLHRRYAPYPDGSEP